MKNVGHIITLQNSFHLAATLASSQAAFAYVNLANGEAEDEAIESFVKAQSLRNV